MEGKTVGQFGVDPLPPRLIGARGMDVRRAGLSHKPVEFSQAVATSQDQLGALLLQCLRERHQAVMQPPTLRAAGGVRAWAGLVEDIDRHDQPILGRRDQRRIVG